MAEEESPSLKELTKKCFKERPTEAKKMFAYRLMGMLVGLGYMKRLQKFKGLPLTESMVAEMAMPVSAYSVPGIASALSPTYVSLDVGGPIKTAQAREGEIVMPTIRKALIELTAAETKVIVVGVPGKKISVVNIALTLDTETDLTWFSGTDEISGKMPFGGTNEPKGMVQGFGNYPLQTAVGESLKLKSWGIAVVSGYITYYLAS